jgi:hypothetical protein
MAALQCNKDIVNRTIELIAFLAIAIAALIGRVTVTVKIGIGNRQKNVKETK